MKVKVLITILTILFFSNPVLAENSNQSPDYSSLPTYRDIVRVCGNDEICMREEASKGLRYYCAFEQNIETVPVCIRNALEHIIELPVCGTETEECLVGTISQITSLRSMSIWRCETSRASERCKINK